MRFEILDAARAGRKVSRPRDYYLNGEGDLFYDCDPNGVDMSGKRHIVAVDSNRFTVVMVNTSTNSAMDAIAALQELVDIVQFHLDGEDNLDSFTLQPARAVLQQHHGAR